MGAVEQLVTKWKGNHLPRKTGTPSISASDFKAKCIACVALDERGFSGVLLGLEWLGFEVTCSSSLEAAFDSVSEDPTEWAMVIIRLDQPLREEQLERYVQLLRYMDARVPVLIMSNGGEKLSNGGEKVSSVSYPNLYADCVFTEPKTLEELCQQLGLAVRANHAWGSKFSDFQKPDMFVPGREIYRRGFRY